MSENFNDNSPDVPPPRKTMAHVGTAMAIVGFLLFFSTFFSAAANFGNFDDFESNTRSMATRAVLGMFLIITGGIVNGAAKRGFKGPADSSGDAFGTDDVGASSIKVRCPKCRQLNDEHDRYCSQCGTKL